MGIARALARNLSCYTFIPFYHVTVVALQMLHATHQAVRKISSGNPCNLRFHPGSLEVYSKYSETDRWSYGTHARLGFHGESWR